MGSYEADNEEAAILAYVNDAGYASLKDLADVIGKTEEELLDEIEVIKLDHMQASVYNEDDDFCGFVTIPNYIYDNQKLWDGKPFDAFLNGVWIKVALDCSAYGLGDPIVRPT